MAIFGDGFDPSLMLRLNEPYGKQMASKIASGISSKGKAASSELSKAQKDFLRAVSQGTLQFDGSVDEETALERMAKGFSGPTSLFDMEGFDFDDFLEDASEVDRQAELLKSSGGILELLSDAYGAHAVAPLDLAVTKHSGNAMFEPLHHYSDFLEDLGEQITDTEETAWNAREKSFENAMKYRDLYDKLIAAKPAPAPFVPAPAPALAPMLPWSPQSGGPVASMSPIWDYGGLMPQQSPMPQANFAPPAPSFSNPKPVAKAAPKPAPKAASKPAPKPKPKNPSPGPVKFAAGFPKPKSAPKPVSKKKPVLKSVSKPNYTVRHPSGPPPLKPVRREFI